MSPEEAYTKAHANEDALNDVIDNQQAEIADLKAQALKQTEDYLKLSKVRDQEWDKWQKQIAVYEEMAKAKDARIAELEVSEKAWKAKAVQERVKASLLGGWSRTPDEAARELEEEMNKK